MPCATALLGATARQQGEAADMLARLFVHVWMQSRLVRQVGLVMHLASGIWQFASRHLPIAAPSVTATAGDTGVLSTATLTAAARTCWSADVLATARPSRDGSAVRDTQAEAR